MRHFLAAFILTAVTLSGANSNAACELNQGELNSVNAKLASTPLSFTTHLTVVVPVVDTDSDFTAVQRQVILMAPGDHPNFAIKYFADDPHYTISLDLTLHGDTASIHSIHVGDSDVTPDFTIKQPATGPPPGFTDGTVNAINKTINRGCIGITANNAAGSPIQVISESSNLTAITKMDQTVILQRTGSSEQIRVRVARQRSFSGAALPGATVTVTNSFGHTVINDAKIDW